MPGSTIVPDSPEQFSKGAQVTAQLLAERSAYALSDVIFDYGSPEFALDLGVKQWHSGKRVNLNGIVPDLVQLQQRAGAGAAVLGYLNTKPEAKGSVLATLSTLREILPTLRINQNFLQAKNLVFYVAAVEYDFVSQTLRSSIASVLQLAKDFGFPALVSDLSNLNEFEATNAVAHALASNGPVIHVYEGIRGLSQARTLSQVADLSKLRILEETVTVESAFAAVNNALGSNIAAVEANNVKSEALVGAGVQDLKALASAAGFSPVAVRLFSQETAAILAKVLPEQVTVLGQATSASTSSMLYQEVAAAFMLFRGLQSLGGLSSVLYEDDNSSSASEVVANLSGDPTVSPKTTDSLSLVWSNDRTAAASIAAPVGRAASYAGIDSAIFSKFDQLVNGGIVEHQIRLGSSSGVPIEEPVRASVGLVTDAAILKSGNPSRFAPGSKILVQAASVEALEKAVPASARAAFIGSEVGVKIYDYSTVESPATEGRTQLFILQILLWKELYPELSNDQIVSRIIHSNTQDMELVAATVQSLVDAIESAPPQEVDTSSWKEYDGPSHEFSGIQATAFEAAALREEEQTGATQLSSLETAKRVLLPEAFRVSQELKPEQPSATYIAKVKVNDRVTPTEYERHIFHLELDISGTGLRYAIGEALGVHAPNDAVLVNEFIQFYGLDPNAVVGVPSRNYSHISEYKTVYQVLRDDLDLFGKVPKRFYEGLAEFATDEKEKTALQTLASPAGAAELKARAEEHFDDYADILKEFPSARPPIEALVDLIAPLKRREYSIASSQRVHPNAVHLLVVVVDWKHRKLNQRFGHCSHFLAELQPGAEVVVSVKRSVMKLPKDSKAPIIMAGLGTGLAPFKAFLEEKQYQRDIEGKEIGEVYLFLGSRHRREEYLYGEIFEAFKASGILTHIGAAFSRDQPEKIYIQHRISQAKEQLMDAFVTKGGNFYLCGPTWPVPDVSAALADIVTTDAAKNGKTIDGDRVIEELKDEERYILEVY